MQPNLKNIWPSVATVAAATRQWTRGVTRTELQVKAQSETVKEATFEVPAYKLHKLKDSPPTSATVTSEDALKLYERMLLLRKLETMAATLYKGKTIRGFCHLYAGQEAIATGMRSVMRPQDTVTTSYRCHAWAYQMGIDAAGVLGELTGRSVGCAKGKGGSMHMYAPKFYGGNGIVGALVPIGTGAGLAHKYKGDGGLSFTLYGDGAANQGQVFEAFNIAYLWKLPVVFVCENNGYGLGTAAHRSSASTDYYTRGDYLPGIWVDGMDVLAVIEATKYAINYCTKEKGRPMLLEMSTYRYYGHSMSDPGTSYRTREEVQEVRKTRDPITRFKERIITSKLATPDQIKKVDQRVKQQIAEATKIATTAKEIDTSEVAGDIYYKNIHTEIRGSHPMSVFKHIDASPRNLK